uniref:Uncharacterized protein n=1 Tax=Glossina pallidipes TaxID=7398 RepID=A0A1A9ZA41_GLOPL
MSQFYRNRRRRQSGEPCDCLRPLIRIFGFISAIVLPGTPYWLQVQSAVKSIANFHLSELSGDSYPSNPVQAYTYLFNIIADVIATWVMNIITIQLDTTETGLFAQTYN